MRALLAQCLGVNPLLAPTEQEYITYHKSWLWRGMKAHVSLCNVLGTGVLTILPGVYTYPRALNSQLVHITIYSKIPIPSCLTITLRADIFAPKVFGKREASLYVDHNSHEMGPLDNITSLLPATLDSSPRWESTPLLYPFIGSSGTNKKQTQNRNILLNDLPTVVPLCVHLFRSARVKNAWRPPSYFFIIYIP